MRDSRAGYRMRGTVVAASLGILFFGSSQASGEIIASIYGGVALTQDDDLRLQQSGGTDLTFHENDQETQMTGTRGYHAHVYYNADTRKLAEGLRDTIANKFGLEPRALCDEPRGPHPIPQFNVIFKAEEFQSVPGF